jgi:hypothetical protein
VATLKPLKNWIYGKEGVNYPNGFEKAKAGRHFLFFGQIALTSLNARMYHLHTTVYMRNRKEFNITNIQYFMIPYVVKWKHINYPEYVLSECGRLFNIKRGKEIKKVVKGYTVGFNIKGTFVSITRIKKDKIFNKIKEINCPF